MTGNTEIEKQPMGEKEKKTQIVYDEMVILKEIYRMKLLSVEQLSQVVFENQRYAYKYMENLEKVEGLVNSRVLMDGRKRQGKAYYLTNKGIGKLEEAGLIDKVRLAKDNVPDKSKMSYTLRLNNLYAGLTAYGVHVYDSREWKKRYKLDRNALVKGGIKLPNGDLYAVYGLFSASYEEEWVVSSRTIKALQSELTKMLGVNRIILLCGGEKSYAQLINAVIRETKDSEFVNKKEVLVLPQGRQAFGNTIIRLLANEDIRETILSEALNARLFKDHEALMPRDASHLEYMSYVGVDKDTGEPFFVVDMLTFNYALITKIKKNYQERWLHKGVTKLKIVCFQSEPGFDGPAGLLREKLRNENIDVVETKVGYWLNYYMPTLKQKKLGQLERHKAKRDE